MIDTANNYGLIDGVDTGWRANDIPHASKEIQLGVSVIVKHGKLYKNYLIDNMCIRKKTQS